MEIYATIYGSRASPFSMGSQTQVFGLGGQRLYF